VRMKKEISGVTQKYLFTVKIVRKKG